MKERPILMSAPMVQAILREVNPKSQTRRVIKPQPRAEYLGYMYGVGGPGTARLVGADYPDADSDDIRCPYGTPGDRLWVKETFCCVADDGAIWYRATDEHKVDDVPFGVRWTPSIFMPRDYSRILLEVTGLRVERVQKITCNDIMREGLQTTLREHDAAVHLREQWIELWDSINAKRGFGWDTNPWVWVVSFRRLKP